MIIDIILKALYFFLPAYIANMAPILFKKLPFLSIPVWENKLGKNKTWRGVVVAIVVGGLVFWLQKLAYNAGFKSMALIDYSDFSIMFGFLLGAGAIVGDLVESYYKRKAGIKAGKSWAPFDQLDFVIGGIFFSFFLYVPQIETIVILFLVSPILHVLFNYIGYLLGINKGKW
jgi:CDP-2,3-bis-(O-geranylgeranyl)-sn-glycerol synthase